MEVLDHDDFSQPPSSGKGWAIASAVTFSIIGLVALVAILFGSLPFLLDDLVGSKLESAAFFLVTGQTVVYGAIILGNIFQYFATSKFQIYTKTHFWIIISSSFLAILLFAYPPQILAIVISIITFFLTIAKREFYLEN